MISSSELNSAIFGGGVFLPTSAWRTRPVGADELV